MKKLFTLSVCIIVIALTLPSYGTQVINFDDITTSSAANIPTNYAGLTWDSNWYVYKDAAYQSYGNTYGSPSGEYAAYNGYGVLNIDITGGPIKFMGANVTSWASYNNYASFSSTTLTVTGYLGGSSIGSGTTSLSPNSYNWFDPGLSSLWIDKLVFTASGNSKWFLMDDFTYTPVPEPGTLLLLGTGLFGLGAIARFRRKK